MEKKKPDRCYFCDVLAQYNFSAQTAICPEHWNQMYCIKVPNYVDDSQKLQFKKLALEKIIWKV